MRIINSTHPDLATIFKLYDEAVAYQKTRFDKHWLAFDKAMVEKEISDDRQWKIMEGDEVVCIFAITYADPFIWHEQKDEPSVYIHRIVTSPLYHGRAYVKIIIEWAKRHARERGKKYVRMDTWGDNQKLIDYYVKCGFTFLGTVTPIATEELPKHYSAIFLSLFEINVDAT